MLPYSPLQSVQNQYIVLKPINKSICCAKGVVISIFSEYTELQRHKKETMFLLLRDSTLTGKKRL